MELIVLIGALLRGFSSIAVGPEWGPKGLALSNMFNLAALALERGGEGAEDLKQLVADVEAMVAAGREPTPEEWEGLRIRSDRAHAILQGTAPAGDVDADA